jgi:4'-phosphopantetheinyl transferase
LSTRPASRPLRFNVSHCDSWALIAVTLEDRVGIDIERLRPLDDLENVARSCFSELELETLLSVPANQRTEAFFNCWTRKEAFIKAWGDGLSYPLGDFDVTLLPQVPAELVSVRGNVTAPAEWSLVAWQPVPGYVAAMAIDQPTVSVSHLEVT